MFLVLHTDVCCVCRPDRLAQAIPQWLERGSGYIGVMRAGTDAHDMTNSPWYEPLGVLHNKKYYMYASGGMYALSSEAVQLLTQVPLSQRRLSGGGDDTSIGLWVMGYNIPYLDDRRLGVYYDKGACPDDFVGEQLHVLHVIATCLCNTSLQHVLSRTRAKTCPIVEYSKARALSIVLDICMRIRVSCRRICVAANQTSDNNYLRVALAGAFQH